MHLDLNEGIESAIRQERTTKNERLDKMLEWILMNKAPFVVDDDQSSPLQTLSTDFVCFRGLLTTLMCTPYEKREDWEFVALKYKETIYLCSIETEQKRLQEQQKNDRQKQMASWGYKFEQFVLSDSINEEEDDAFGETKKVKLGGLANNRYCRVNATNGYQICGKDG